MKKIFAAIIMGVLCLSIFSMLAPKGIAEGSVNSNAPPVNYTPVVPKEKWGSAEVLVIEDVIPWYNSSWPIDAVPAALNSLNKTYDLIHSDHLANLTLAEYRTVILASDQPTSTYVNVAANIGKIDSYVCSGGVYVCHACDHSWSGGDWSNLQIMPGNVTHVTGYYSQYIHINNPNSPVVDGLNDAYFAGWGQSTHGYFTNVPAGVSLAMVTETSFGSGVPDPNKPTYITYSYGSGKVLATMQPVEWGWSGVYWELGAFRKQFLINGIHYAKVVGNGYIILVSGNYVENKKDLIDESTNQVYDDLTSLGYTADRIYYLNKDSNWRVNDVASSLNLEWAIRTWAAARVGTWEPLFLIMFDHGGVDSFSVNNPGNTGDSVSSSSLNSWLNTLESGTGASTYVVYSACESGSFIDDLSKFGSGGARVIITSSNQAENSAPSVAPYWEFFQTSFWPRIMMGDSLLAAFNPSSQFAFNSASYHPLLDDNGDGVGHGFDTPTSSGYLPHDADGYLSANVYFTKMIQWHYPFIGSVAAKTFFRWPPPPEVNLWVKVENVTRLLSVTAWMLPPDWSLPPPGHVLIQVPFQPFNMTEQGDSGIWTVNIPAAAFMAHANGTSNFRFMITAEEANSSAIPLWTAVEFTPTDLPPPDTTAPQVDILRPKDMQHVEGTIIISGTATDNVRLQTLALYVNNSLTQAVNVTSPESSSFFQFAYTPPGSYLSPTEFTVKAFDASGNSGAQTVRVNTLRDIAVTKLTPQTSVVTQGYSLPINVTVANEGQLTEAFKAIVYANETFIYTTTVTLGSNASTELAFLWNATGFAQGNYIIKAVASPLPYEINIANNELDSVVSIVATTPTVVVRGQNNLIYYRTYNVTAGSWTGWNALPGATIDSPAAAVCNNELHVVVRGADGSTLYHGYVNLANSAFSGWTLLSGSTPSTSTLTSNGTTLALVVRGGDNRIYYRFYTIASQSWTSWSALPSGTTLDGPAASLVGGTLHIVVKGSDGSSLWYSNINPSTQAFSGWTLLSGSTPSIPTLTSSSTALTLVVRGGDNRIYYRFYTIASQTWTAWSALPSGTTQDSPAATMIGNTLCIVVRGSDGTSLWQSSIDLATRSFSGWTLLSGSTPSKPTLT